jgi:hypothetical protein
VFTGAEPVVAALTYAERAQRVELLPLLHVEGRPVRFVAEEL